MSWRLFVCGLTTQVKTAAASFVNDEGGQDLVEYALLAALVGIIGILTWQAIGTGVGTDYTGWDGAIQGLSSNTPDPIGGGS